MFRTPLRYRGYVFVLIAPGWSKDHARYLRRAHRPRFVGIRRACPE